MKKCKVKLDTLIDGESTVLTADADVYETDSFLRYVFSHTENADSVRYEIIVSKELPRVRIRQSGAISSDMCFEEGHAYGFDYNAMGLSCRVLLYTESLESDKDKNSVKIKYTLTIDDQKSDCLACVAFIQ